MLEVNSYIRGYRVYKAVWEVTCGDVLRLEREHNNNEDRFVVAVLNYRELFSLELLLHKCKNMEYIYIYTVVAC